MKLQNNTVKLVKVAEDLSSPIVLVSPPDDPRRFIVDEVGLIIILDEDGKRLELPFLDLTAFAPAFSQERNDPRGLLGLAFHPQYAETGRFFVFYTVNGKDGIDHYNRVSEFTVSKTDPNVADPKSERILLEVAQETIEHSAGQLVFDQNGYLFVSIGDDFNPAATAQDYQDLRGSLLRIDVDKQADGKPYAIPADNPYVGKPETALPEIYAKGLRHPWRLSFDQETNQLYISDPAWTFRSSRVYVAEPGANYGWELQTEGRCFEAGKPQSPVASCLGSESLKFTPPVVEYWLEFGRIITGGTVYRGSALPELQGKMIGAEWGVLVDDGAKLFVATPPAKTGELWTLERLNTDPSIPADSTIWSLGTDSGGEVYVLTMTGAVVGAPGGIVWKIVPQGD